MKGAVNLYLLHLNGSSPIRMTMMRILQKKP